jgi:signal transduction histidine kinase
VGEALASTRETDVALARVASLIASSIADLCLVDVVARDGVPVRVVAEQGDPPSGGELRELRRFPPDGGDPTDPFGRVVRTGESLLVPEVDEGWLDTNIADEEYRALLRAVGPRSLVVVPLAVRGTVLGVATLASTDPSRRYGIDHLRLAEEVGRRIALAVDHERLGQDAEAAERTGADFMAAMSHEFRTPVHVASMFAELLLMGVPEPIPPASRAHAEHIRAAVRHLDKLVEQVLTFARLEAEREVVRTERVDVVDLARETAGLVEPLARQKQLGFGTDLPGTGRIAYTDPNKVRQILFNLLGNAVKFTESGEVRLTVRESDAGVTLEVRDTGVGIAAEHVEKIFEPFWRVERDSVAGAEGTGLGLGIVRSLVQLLDGEVTVRSEEGSGSVFRVTLPLRREET